MNDLEQRLKSMRLAAPSTGLDRRIDDVFLAAQRIRARSRKAIFWWGLAAATAAGGMAALLLVTPRPSPPVAPAVIYQVEAQGLMRQLLLNPTVSRDEPPGFVIRVSAP